MSQNNLDLQNQISKKVLKVYLTHYQPMFSSYRNQSYDLQNKSIDWFLYDVIISRKRVKLIPLRKGLPTFSFKIMITNKGNMQKHSSRNNDEEIQFNKLLQKHSLKILVLF